MAFNLPWAIGEPLLLNLCVEKRHFFPVPGVCGERSLHPDKQKDSDYSDLGKSRPDEDDNGRDKDGRRDEDNRSKAAESSHTASSDSEKPESSQSIPLPPKDSTQKSSASARRALFARRRFDASTSASSGGSRSPGTQPVVPQREPSPPRSPPPGPHSPSSCHVSPSALRPVSPVRSLSPIIVQSHGLEFSGPPGCLADTSAPCRGCLHPRGRQSTARLVSHFSFCFKKTLCNRPAQYIVFPIAISTCAIKNTSRKTLRFFELVERQ